MSSAVFNRGLQALPKASVTRLRQEVGARVGGLRSGTGFTPTLKFNAVVQPTTAAQMRMLTGGEEVRGAITIWTNQDLRTSETRGDVADRVDVRGLRYKVVEKFDWQGQGFAMYIAGTEVVESP